MDEIAHSRDLTYAKGLRARSSPMGTLNQNGYNIWKSQMAQWLTLSSDTGFRKANRKRQVRKINDTKTALQGYMQYVETCVHDDTRHTAWLRLPIDVYNLCYNIYIHVL